MRPEGRALLHHHAQSMFADLVELVALDRDSIVEALRATTLSESEREQIAAVSGGYPLALDALLRSPGARMPSVTYRTSRGCSSNAGSTSAATCLRVRPR